MLDFPVVPPKKSWFEMVFKPEDFNAEAEDLWGEVQRFEASDGKLKWRCAFCLSVYNCLHATKALWHLAQASGGGIAPCAARLPPWLRAACVAKIKASF